MTNLVEPKRLMVGIAPDDHSDEAIRAAVRLSGKFGAELDLVHVVSPMYAAGLPMAPGVLEGIQNQHMAIAHESIRRRLGARREYLGLTDEHLEQNLRFVLGHPTHALAALADESRADLLFIGSHKKRGVIGMGSSARGVLAHAHCGVWMQPCEAKTIHSILVPTDLSEESLASLRIACRLAQEHGARVRVLHCIANPDMYQSETSDHCSEGLPTYVLEQVISDSRRAFESAMRDFDFQGIEHDWQCVVGDPGERILEHQQDADLIAMGTHGRSGVARFLLGSVAYHVIRTAEVPVLAIPIPDRKWLVPSPEEEG